ncbi:MAG TPA: CDP-alcohol phosphatidyltransferase family protein [Candidatus Eremiobacteraeota bacterium]|nr:MAG: Bifunctional IPC transferase and DIPP synthase [bacterium ADurb.Bin363]HPZ08928.1 CDP-alcohol phosphatidyltransferase family protein [Candidatus Eremiobacteraeota bacterium]
MIYELRQTSHRRYYIKIADYFSKLGFTPNTWTIIGFFMGFFMAVMIYFRSYLWAMVFGLLMAFCDIMDGEIAKLKNNTTPFGRLLDVTVDKYVEGFIGLAAGLSMPQVLLPSLVWAALSIWGSVLISVVSNVGGMITTKKPFKLVGRGDRGLIIWIGLILGMINPVFFTYSIICITVLSHITVSSLLIEYSFILKKEGKSLPGKQEEGKLSSPTSVETFVVH